MLTRWRREALWLLLALVLGALLSLLIWLAQGHETSLVQSRLDRDAGEAVSDVRSALTRNVQSLQLLVNAAGSPNDWRTETNALLRTHREMVRVELRNDRHHLLLQEDSPFRSPVFDRLGRENILTDVAQACAVATRISAAAYSRSYFVPTEAGLGLEIMELCLPMVEAGKPTGFIVATYSLQDMLEELIGRGVTRGREVSFTEGDGTRLAVRGTTQRGDRLFSAQHLLDLPGTALVLRLDAWLAAPDLFPNVLTAMVTALTIALAGILALLGHDMRRRLQAERGLADALAFRKAMEDSLVTGLRARDLQGRITYVNPAFCQMVGFSAQELMGQFENLPYWPPEFAEDYAKRQAIRLAGNPPPREGFESVFMHQDGTRFPVLIFEAPLINEQGVQTGWMSAFMDIREQRRVEDLSRASHERLQATARLAMVGEMASLLSHELNQPLAAISSYATGSINWLKAQNEVATDIQQALERIAQQAERAGRVIKSVHDFVRRRDQAHETVSAQALWGGILPLVNLQARKLFVRVKLDIEPDLPPVRCDRTMVEQVLLNLARNGMQAMDQVPADARVLVLRVRHAQPSQEKWLMFDVADHGHGIPDDVQAQLFTPFFTTKSEGMGLGLSLCRTVTEQHGSALTYRPNDPQGAVFTFGLPVG